MDTRIPGAVPTAFLKVLSGGACLTKDEISAQFSDLNNRQITEGLLRLLDRGYLEKMDGDCLQLTMKGLQAAKDGITITSGPKGPTGIVYNRRDTFRGRVWTAMRIRRYFTIGEVAGDAKCAEDKEPEQNATRYMLQLRKSGYVAELARRQKGGAPGSNGFKRFVLIRNTGPRAPVYRAKHDAVHDFNTGEDFKCSQV